MAGEVRVRLDQPAIAKLLESEQGIVGKDLLKRAVKVEGAAKRLCPVDTGRLRSSITHDLERDHLGLVAFVGTNVEYAIFVGFGTRYMGARPYLRPGVEVGTMTTTFVDVERPVRDWLRTESLTGVGDRVYVGLPTDVTFTAIDVTLVDGGIQPGEAPLAACLFSFSVWAESRTSAAEIVWALVALLQGLRYENLTTVVLLSAVIVTGPTPRPDPDNFPRYLLDATLTVRVA